MGENRLIVDQRHIKKTSITGLKNQFKMQAAEIILVPQMLDTVKTELQKERRTEIRQRKFQNKL